MVNIRKTTGADGKGIVYYLPDSLINNTHGRIQYRRQDARADLDKTQALYRTRCRADDSAGAAPLRQNWNRFFDASIAKRTASARAMNVEFRATALNVFNMTNFGNNERPVRQYRVDLRPGDRRLPRHLRHGRTRRPHPGVHAAVQLLTCTVTTGRAEKCVFFVSSPAPWMEGELIDHLCLHLIRRSAVGGVEISRMNSFP